MQVVWGVQAFPLQLHHLSPGAQVPAYPLKKGRPTCPVPESLHSIGQPSHPGPDLFSAPRAHHLSALFWGGGRGAFVVLDYSVSQCKHTERRVQLPGLLMGPADADLHTHPPLPPAYVAFPTCLPAPPPRSHVASIPGERRQWYMAGWYMGGCCRLPWQQDSRRHVAASVAGEGSADVACNSAWAGEGPGVEEGGGEA